MKNTILAEKNYEGEEIAYGILVKDMEAYEYFKNVVHANRLRLAIGGASFWNEIQKDIIGYKVGNFYSTTINKLFSPSNSIIVISIMIGIIVLFGIFYELKRKLNTMVKRKEELLLTSITPDFVNQKGQL